MHKNTKIALVANNWGDVLFMLDNTGPLNIVKMHYFFILVGWPNKIVLNNDCSFPSK